MSDTDRARNVFLRLNATFKYAGAGLVLWMMLSIVYDVIARKLFRAPTAWVVDVSAYAIVYVTFLLAAGLLASDRHIKVDAVVSQMRSRARRVLGFAMDLMALCYCVILTWQSWLVAWEAFQRDFRFSTVVGIPQFPVLVVIPVGSAWLCVAFLVRLSSMARQGVSGAALVAGE